MNYYDSINNIETPYNQQNKIIYNYEIPNNKIDNKYLINKKNSKNQQQNVYTNVKSNNYYLKKNINNQINNDLIAVVTKLPNQNKEKM